ncbi:hypothetical protein LJ655_05345 [Paraburkholderia sp. MMS20-SJTN17]|uniref:Uncharacterized protein n=1 Tax=Paraburkholderia translucens TaxID=2886945 RepID=A0ABS8K997_9BURK|nr:hypothetical protein [Paraburkholderia sp. MMS20-SJTN17]MCC8401325.1 hypothetical protein [Paraburkholderia sp. MMS20-SJTN17]
MTLDLRIGTTDDFILARINAGRDFSKFKQPCFGVFATAAGECAGRASDARRASSSEDFFGFAPGTVLAQAGAVAYNSRRPRAAGHGNTAVQSLDGN